MKQQHKREGENKWVQQQKMKRNVHFQIKNKIQVIISTLAIKSLCDVTHLAQKQRTRVSLDWCWCRARHAGAAGSCTGRCRPAAAAAGWGCRWCPWDRAPRTAGPYQWGTGRRRRRMEGCCRGDAVSGTTPPQVLGPSDASESPLQQPRPPQQGGDRGARPSPQNTSLPTLCQTHGHLQRGKGIKLRIWPMTLFF